MERSPTLWMIVNEEDSAVQIDSRSTPFGLGPSLLPTLPPIADTREPRVSGEKVPRLAPYTRQQVPLWAGYAIPLLAGRAFWLGQNETCFSVRASGDVVMGHLNN
jgi:hypothetical protein